MRKKFRITVEGEARDRGAADAGSRAHRFPRTPLSQIARVVEAKSVLESELGMRN